MIPLRVVLYWRVVGSDRAWGVWIDQGGGRVTKVLEGIHIKQCAPCIASIVAINICKCKQTEHSSYTHICSKHDNKF